MKNIVSRFILVSVFLLASFCTVSCSGLFSSLSEGAVSLTLPGTSSSARSASDGTEISDSKEIAKFELSFSMGGSVKTLSALPGETITQDSLEPGTWTITGRALTAAGICIGYGTVSAKVTAGKTTNAALAMSFNSYANLASIAVTKNPAKTEYTIGDTVDYTGIEITASFKSGWKCVLDTSSLKDRLTCSPAEGSTLTSFTDKVTVTFTSGTTVCTADFPITVSVDAPVIIQDASSDTKRVTVNTAASYSVTATCKGEGRLSFQWIQTGSTKATYTTDPGTPETTDSGITQTGTFTVTPATEGSDDYYCIVTNTNNGSSKTAESVHFTVEYTTATLTSITAEPKAGSYVLVGNEPAAALFTITETWSDGNTSTGDSGSYNVTAGNTSYVGNITVTVTRKADPSITCSSTIPYKYTMTAPTLTFSDTAVSEAQYTGNTTLSVTISNSPHTYYDADKKTTDLFYDSVTYQWLKDGTAYDNSTTTSEAAPAAKCTPDVSTAGSYKYTLTASVTGNTSYKNYCTGTVPEAVTSGAWPVTVTAWTATYNGTSVTGGSTLTVAMGTSPSLVISNKNDTTSTLTVTSGDTGTATVSQNVTAGNAITIKPVKAGSTTLTVKAGTSTLMTLTVTVKSLTSISAVLTGSTSYLLVGNEPAAGMFTVTKIYEDSSTETAATGEYTVKADNTSYVGNATVTVTLTADTSKTCTVTVPYKYTMVAPKNGALTASSASIAQYTGSTTLTASCDGFTSYSTSDGLNIVDTATYQWYSAATEDGSGTLISGATNATYTPSATAAGTVWYYAVITTKCGSDATYCANSTDTLTATTSRTAVTVTAWTLSLTDTTKGTTAVTIANGGTQALTAGDSYSMQFANADADTTSAAIAGNSAYVSWASDNTATLAAPAGSAPWTFTAPSATSDAQTITLTATLKSNSGTATFGIVTFTVPAASITDFTSLSTALASGGAISVSGTITMTGGLTVSADTVITVPSGQTATLTRDSTAASVALFTVSSGKSLTLGGSSSGTLTIDGGGKETTPVSATASLITTTGGTVIINENAVLQNNVFSSSSSNSYGGAIYAGASSTVTIAGGTVQNNDLSAKSSSLGGGVYVKKGSFSMTSGTISGNKSEKEGGGLYVEGASGSLAPLSITGGSITGNTAGADTTSQTSNGGGGIYAYYATVNITGTADKSITISDNTTDGYGGGIHFSTGTTGTVSYGTIKSNTAISHGGGVYTAGDSSITLTSCSLQNNTCSSTAGYGGGLCDDASSGTTTLTGGSVTGNSATNGAGISVNASGAQLVITGTSISENTKGDAGTGSGIYDYGKLSIGGAFMIASGNDLYFSTNNATAIAITGTLTTATSGSPITLTLPSYVSGISVFTAGTGVTLSDEISKFALADTSSVKLGTDGSTATK